jgi:FKBP12-rapamycin complex-associated protein
MQLFGLVNNLLANDRQCAKRDLSITRYPVIPLAPNSGLIGWVSDTDTLHALIREYRESRKILLNIEHRLMLSIAPDYDNLTLIQKVEVFQYALENTMGQDLYKVLWLKSRNSEVWLEKRTNYTRSLAVMSMVGYILGLGDRHPSNLMLNRHTGKLLHIDFGDCFEVAMHRDKFPEKIPFRLTRMLMNAMEVSGIEGTFRMTCENVMRVLRENKGSLMAMLEAFAHDPIINWRLLTDAPTGPDPSTTARPACSANVALLDGTTGRSAGASTSVRETTNPDVLEAPEEVLNERAVAVIARINSKLTGKDFGEHVTLDVQSQVQRLVEQATSHENLCQCYIGWCPFW